MRTNGWTVAIGLLALLGGCDLGTGPEERVARVTISPAGGTIASLQDTLRLSAEVVDRGGRPVAGVTPEWTSLDPEVATVDGDGRVVARSPGEALIAASAGEAADTVPVVVEGGAPTGALRFVALALTAPPLVTYDTSFWAVKGSNRELEIRTVASAHDEDGERFLRFEVPAETLLRRPDGTLFQEDDSVRIHVRVSPDEFIFQFEPSGLRFDPERPARLEVRYADADEDDLAREQEFALWKQESPVSAWLRIATVKLEELDELEAEITSFTAFSLATR
jgi:hypothetical protein